MQMLALNQRVDEAAARAPTPLAPRGTQVPLQPCTRRRRCPSSAPSSPALLLALPRQMRCRVISRLCCVVVVVLRPTGARACIRLWRLCSLLRAAHPARFAHRCAGLFSMRACARLPVALGIFLATACFNCDLLYVAFPNNNS